MKKQELEVRVAELEANVTELEGSISEGLEDVDNYECLLSWLESKISRVQVKQTGRKEQVLKILQSAGHITVEAISLRIGISARNVSSQLTYLRRDGYAIATDSLGRKFLE